MNNAELELFRRLVNDEVNNRKVAEEIINKDNNLVKLQDYLVNIDDRDPKNIRNIVKKVLSNFNVENSSNVYVCTYASGINDSFGGSYIARPSEDVESKIFIDIETLERIRAKKFNSYYIITDFQKDNLIFNPHDAMGDPINVEKNNGFDEVRLYFFEECYEKDVDEAIKTLKLKYPRL